MKNIIIATLATLALTSCTEDMDLNLKSAKQRLVVDGHLYDVVTPENYVRLTMSAEYFSNKEPEPVSMARVSVSDGVKETVFEEDTERKGYYIAPEGFRALNDCIYTLTITDVDADADGVSDLFTAQSYMPKAAKADSISCYYDRIQELYGIRFYSYEDTSEANYYMFGFSLCDSLVTDTYMELAVQSDDWFTTDYCWGATVYMFNEDYVNRPIHNGDKLTMHAYSINKEFYDYFLAMQDIYSGGNPMFSSAPANAQGNISGGALGIFTTMVSVDLSCQIEGGPQ